MNVSMNPLAILYDIHTTVCIKILHFQDFHDLFLRIAFHSEIFAVLFLRIVHSTFV